MRATGSTRGRSDRQTGRDQCPSLGDLLRGLNVTVEGLIVEKYASPTQRGAIGFSGPGSDWVVRGNEVRWNHGAGIRLADRMQVLDNFIQHQGQIGIAGSGSDVLVQGNEIAFNNTAGFGLGPQSEAGATKFTFTNRLVVRDNFSHHNHGPGLWTDIDNHDCLYEGNRVEDNDWRGIFHEISYACVIRNNVVRNNGHALPAGGPLFVLDGAGILVSSSADVEVYGNVVEATGTGSARSIPIGGAARGAPMRWRTCGSMTTRSSNGPGLPRESSGAIRCS